MGRLGAPLAALLADLFPPMGHLGFLEGVLGLSWGSCGRLLGGPFLFHGSFLVHGGYFGNILCRHGTLLGCSGLLLGCCVLTWAGYVLASELLWAGC